MKKTKSIILTLTLIILIFATMGIGVGAANITTVGDSESNNLKGTFVKQTTSIVYSIDIAWGSLEFTYTEDSEGTWAPETHAYINPSVGGWTYGTDANKITVTNHSNKAVFAYFDFTPNLANNDIDVTFYDDADLNNKLPVDDDKRLYIYTADSYGFEEHGNFVSAGQRVVDAYLNITSGKLTSGTNAEIGSVTVTINSTEGRD